MMSLGTSSLEGGAGVTELKILTVMCCLYLVSSALMLIVVLFLAILCVLMCDVICNDVMKLVPTDQRQLTYTYMCSIA